MMKFFFGMQIKIEVFYKLILSLWVCETKHAQRNQNKNFSYLCNITRKACGMKLIFCMEINMKVFYKMIISLCLYVYKHAQSTQNNIFAISLQYLKENVKDEVDFLLSDKHQRFLQIDVIILNVCGQSNKFAIS